MPISVIQFNGSNAYEFQPGEFITSREFGILNMDDLALGVEVYTANTTSRLKATMRFIDEHGVLLSTSSSTYTPTVQNLWERALFTWSVPEGATRAELRLEGLTSVILMAQPKVANGTDPGSYGSNWSPQLTFLTPTGIYTGTLSAKQIILSAGEDLSDRLVTINQNHLALVNRIKDEEDRVTLIEAGMVKLGNAYNGVEIDQTKGLEINSTIGGKTVKVKLNAAEGLAYYQDNAFKGGLKVVNDELAMVSNVVSNDSTLKTYASLGKTGPLQGLRIYDLNVQSRPMISMEAMLDGGVYLQDHQGIVLSRSVLGFVNLIATGSGGALSLYPPNVVAAYGGGFVLGNATNGGILGRSNGNIEIGKMLTVGSLQIGTRQLTASGDDLYWNGKKILTT